MSDKAAETKAVVSVGERGVKLRNIEEMYRFAQYVVAAGWAPTKKVNGKHVPGSAEEVLIAIQKGFEVGLAPLQAVQGIAVINGRPSLYGDAFWALASGAPVIEDVKTWIEGEGMDMVARCIIKRKDRPSPYEQEFSMNDAKLAGLLDKPGPWKQYPKRMLQFRCRTFCARDAVPEYLAGLTTVEEAIDYGEVEELAVYERETVNNDDATVAMTERLKAKKDSFDDTAARIQAEVEAEKADAQPKPEAPEGDDQLELQAAADAEERGEVL